MHNKIVLLSILLVSVFADCVPTFTKLDSQQIDTILQKHNELRQQVASGNQKDQPSASNMQKMVWNEDLELGAQEWANSCQFKNSGGPYGENISQMMNSVSINPDKQYLDSLVQMWYDQVSDFDSSNISPYQFTYQSGAYTQLEWAESNQLGCGVSIYKESGWNKIYMVCRYLKQGNMIGSEMYLEGKPCNQCPDQMQCDQKYDALCSYNQKNQQIFEQ